MSFIKMNLKDVQEAEIVPEAEYDLRIHSAEEVASKSKAGNTNIKVLITIEDSEYPKAAPITTFLSLPNDRDDAKALEFKMLQIKRFLKLFSIAFNDDGFNVEDFAGQTARCLVVQEEITKQGEGNERIKTGEMANALRLPKLANESEEDEKPARGARGSSGRRR